MKKALFFVLFTFLLATAFGQRKGRRGIHIIPEPVSLVRSTGEMPFIVPKKLMIVTPKSEEIKRIATLFAARLETATLIKIGIQEGTAALPQSLLISLVTDPSIPKEGYRLAISKNGILLEGSNAAGIFYGMQTLQQIFPADIESKFELDEEVPWELPAVKIEDHPRFGWRGLMLDVSRHFFTVPQVKEFIDQMVKYKFNLLHLHLTDDQGWRIEIKSLPKLTSVGAWRVERTGTFGTLSKPEPGEPATYGGFYTHEDIKELVKYASERYVDILPEIDIPGHSLAALAAYPQLSCTPGEYYVSPGDRFMVWPGGGQHFYGLIDNTICPANEWSYVFIDQVFTEVAQLFPFGYIHMGGDETARNFWEKNDQVKQLMQKEGLKNLDEVQSYFVKRVEKIINSKGKKMIGWDEILQGGLAPNAAVMSWRGMKGGVKAAKMGHEVVMSPTDFVYLDYMQGDAAIEPPVYASLRLKKTYQFEPLPDSVNPNMIKGGQANLWTEQIYNTRHMQYMLWPRAFAVAEALWSPKSKKNWNQFIPRVEYHFRRLTAAGVKYAPSMYDPIVNVSKKDSARIEVTLSTEIDNLAIHYSFDNSFPDEYYPVYKNALLVPKDAVALKLITCRDHDPVGRMIVIPVTELKKRAGIK